MSGKTVTNVSGVCSGQRPQERVTRSQVVPEQFLEGGSPTRYGGR
jgi:hypothetical protein